MLYEYDFVVEMPIKLWFSLRLITIKLNTFKYTKVLYKFYFEVCNIYTSLGHMHKSEFELVILPEILTLFVYLLQICSNKGKTV